MKEVVSFTDDEALFVNAERVFETVRSMLLTLLPAAGVEHVGSTALPRGLTKGDLDIAVVVAPQEFLNAAERLSARFAPSAESEASDRFRHFEGHLGKDKFSVLLITHGSIEHRKIIGWRDLLIANPHLKAEYEALKRAHQGGLMSGYRQAKEQFILTHLDLLPGAEHASPD
ncbi:MAG: GrpB family protein [Pseudomonadota bacterium]